MSVVVVVLVVEPVADTPGGQPKAEPMELRAARGLAVERQRVQEHFGRRLIRLGGSRQCAQNRLGPAPYSRLARHRVDTATVAGYECRPAFRIADALLGFVDQPVQGSVAAIADQVADPWTELLHDAAEVIDGGGFVHLAPRADNAAQVGAGIVPRSTVLACQRIDDDP